MKHRVKGTKLGTDSQHRKSLLRNLLRALFEHGQIVTTEPKAKEVKRLADKLVYRAQTDTVASRRQLHKFFGKRDVVNTLVERIAPAFKKRKSGFTKIVPTEKRRGDNVRMLTISLLEKPKRLGTLRSGKDVAIQRLNKVAKKAAKPKVVKTKAKLKK
ncbi:MAG: 50S ribosomal protein L17 [Patescibacteria group bacterium]